MSKYINPAPYDLTPIIELLSDADPFQWTLLLDEMLNIMVQYSQSQGSMTELDSKYHQVRSLRDGFHRIGQSS